MTTDIETLFIVAPYCNKIMPHHGIGYLRSYLEREGYPTGYLDLSAPDYLDPGVRSCHYATLMNEGNTVYSSVDFLVDCFFGEGPEKRFGKAMTMIFRDTVGKYADRVEERNPDAAAFTLYDSNLVFSAALAGELKRRNPRLITVFGGPFLVDPNVVKVLSELKDIVDYMIIGEGEEAAAGLLSYLAGREKRPPRTCISPGDDIGEEAQRGNLINDIEHLPFPIYDGAPFGDYRNNMARALNYSNVYAAGEIILPLTFGRGCPFRCSFCGHNAYWTRYRLRSVENVLDEISYLKERYGCRVFRINDSLMNMNREWLADFCDALTASDAGIYWYGHTRASGMDRELAEKMYRAGCRYMKFGLESGSDRILKLMNKKSTVGEHSKAVKAARRAGVKVRASFIYGFPGESRREFGKTLDFIEENKPFMDGIRIFEFLLVPESDIALHPDKYGADLDYYRHDLENRELSRALSRIPRKWHSRDFSDEELKKRRTEVKNRFDKYRKDDGWKIQPPTFPDLLDGLLNRNRTLVAEKDFRKTAAFASEAGTEVDETDGEILDRLTDPMTPAELETFVDTRDLRNRLFKLLSLGSLKIYDRDS